MVWPLIAMAAGEGAKLLNQKLLNDKQNKIYREGERRRDQASQTMFNSARRAGAGLVGQPSAMGDLFVEKTPTYRQATPNANIDPRNVYGSMAQGRALQMADSQALASSDAEAWQRVSEMFDRETQTQKEAAAMAQDYMRNVLGIKLAGAASDAATSPLAIGGQMLSMYGNASLPGWTNTEIGNIWTDIQGKYAKVPAGIDAGSGISGTILE